MEKKYYVTMTDKILSGWGGARGKIAKYVIICDTREQAERAMAKAERRSEMKYINLHYDKPYYNCTKYQVTFEHINEASYFQ